VPPERERKVLRTHMDAGVADLIFNGKKEDTP
jgi:hypothetical protein